MATKCPPSFEEIALADGVTAWAAAVEGLSAWSAAALRRGATPAELGADWIRWWDVATERRQPAWASRNEIVFEAPVARLRDFSTDRRSRLLPTLVLPPQAGHDSCIVEQTLGDTHPGTLAAVEELNGIEERIFQARPTTPLGRILRLLRGRRGT